MPTQNVPMPKKTSKGLSYLLKKAKQGGKRPYYKFQYVDREGRNKVLYLGFIDNADATYYAENLKRLVDCSRVVGKMLPDPVQAFIDSVDYAFRRKLIEQGLVVETERDAYEAATTVGKLVDTYLEYHKNAIYNTLKGMKLAVAKFVDFFGRNKKLCDITTTEVKHFESHLYSKYSEAYASRLAGRVQEICRIGIKQKLSTKEWFESTFKELRIGKMYNKERREIVSIDKYRKIVSVCVNAELRFAFYLARFLAFRCPSECNLWRWSYLDFENREVKVLDTKRKETRLLPMFPYLYPFFAELLHYHQCKRFLADIKTKNLPLVWNSEEMISLMRKNGATYVAEMVKRFNKGKDFIFSERFRSRKSRGKQIPQLLKKAKVTLEKPFVNMRGTREGEWLKMYDIYTACEWTGNSVKVAAKHYLSISPETWKKALNETDETGGTETMRDLLKRHSIKELHDLIEKAVSKMENDEQSEANEIDGENAE